jgi:hypothetical protein
MKTAYKGFDKDLKCRNEQFQAGVIYSKNNGILNPKLCSSDGYHYCNKLTDVFSFYSAEGNNRFCEIEILGPYTDDSNKSITTAFKIIRELSKEEVIDVQRDSYFDLDLLQTLQKEYPMFVVGGSTALYLHGVRLKRWKGVRASDFDLISPYYVAPESNEALDLNIDFAGGKSSSNDFDYTFSVNGTKIDFRIDPKQRYEVITYKGIKYKVSPILDILEAKIRYARLGNAKHKNDIEEMMLPSKVQSTVKINIPDVLDL